jgi:hypothetical protein
VKVVYVSGPYRSRDGINGIFENIMAARAVALECWAQGHAVICPHLNSAFMDGTVADDMFLLGDLEILRRCDAIVMVPGWERSAGACDEHRLAKELGLEIVYWKMEGWHAAENVHLSRRGAGQL